MMESNGKLISSKMIALFVDAMNFPSLQQIGVCWMLGTNNTQKIHRMCSQELTQNKFNLNKCDRILII